MGDRTWAALLCLSISASIGCGDSMAGGSADAGSSVDGGQAAALGAETLGQSCTGACGAADDRKCTTTTADCPLCMVDPGHQQITYCSQDCTSQPCPSGWTCENVKAFGQDSVESACVADTAQCGDGVLQLGEECDGDDPMLGRCVSCEGYEAVCGDGSVQTGEVCDGDDPLLGRCVDCERFEAICGDGVVQAGEACDGNSAVGYCINCERLETPRVVLSVRSTTRTNGVQRQEGNSTWYYGFGFEDMNPTLAIPAEGDARGCGRVEILEATSEATRIAFTLCDQEGWGTATWTVGLPRASNVRVQLSDPEIPSIYRPEHVVEGGEGSYRLGWDIAHARRFQVSSFMSEPPAFTRGNLEVWLEQPDPMVSFADAEARLEVGFVILHPLL